MDAAQYKSLKPWLDTGQEWAPIAGIALVVFYVLDSLFLFLIARKTGTGPAILAFLPVFDTYLQFRIAEKPIWWFLLSIFVAPVAIIMYLYRLPRNSQCTGKIGHLGGAHVFASYEADSTGVPWPYQIVACHAGQAFRPAVDCKPLPLRRTSGHYAGPTSIASVGGP